MEVKELESTQKKKWRPAKRKRKEIPSGLKQLIGVCHDGFKRAVAFLASSVSGSLATD